MTGDEHKRTIDILPPFCEPRVVLATVIVAELLVAVVALSSTGQALGSWRGFSLTSLYAQWVALTAISLLCVAREQLSRLGVTIGLIIAWVLILGVTLTGALIAWWLTHRFDSGLNFADRDLARFVFTNVSLSALVSAAALRYLHVQSEWERQIRAEAQSRVEALQARIRPHFLFNSMNTIASLIRSKPEIAEEAVEDLSELFRGALSEHSETSLAEEFSIVRNYLRLEKLRLGARLSVNWNVDAMPTDARLPPLSLQPLVENAIYHGIQPSPGGGAVEIRGERDANILRLTVANTLPGTGPNNRRDGNRMAQNNIAQRMKFYFGPRGSLRIDETEQSYRAILEFPYHPKSAQTHAHPDR